MANLDIFTDYNALLNFEKNLRSYCDDLRYDLNNLLTKTEDVTQYSWKGEQADKFYNLIENDIEEIKKEIDDLLAVADRVHEAALILKKGRDIK